MNRLEYEKETFSILPFVKTKKGKLPSCHFKSIYVEIKCRLCADMSSLCSQILRKFATNAAQFFLYFNLPLKIIADVLNSFLGSFFVLTHQLKMVYVNKIVWIRR